MSALGKCLCAMCCLTAIVVIIFVSLSVSTLPVNTYGLDYSPISKKINTESFVSGFHFLGFMHKFIEYPSQIITIDFSDDNSAERPVVESRSIDGLSVKFSVQFQYTLKQYKLRELYFRYGEDYKNPCVRFAVDIFNDRATFFTASMFFKDLGTVQEDMRKALVDVWDKECFATVNTVQVSKAKLPYNYEVALQATQIASQSSITANQTQENTKIEMQTKINQATIAAPIVINQAVAKVNATLATNLASAQSYLAVTKSESNAYKNMKVNLDFNGPDSELLNYIKVKTISNYNQAMLIQSVPKS